MRGTYQFTNQDRDRIFFALRDLINQRPYDSVSLVGANVSLCDCQDALEELGYEHEDCDNNGWEMDFWWTFEAVGLPAIMVGGCGYTGDLYIYFKDQDLENPDIDTEALRQRINERWEKYGLNRA